VFASSATTQTISGLTNGASYTFTIVATNTNGSGPASDPSAPTNVGAPGPPGAVSVASGDGRATVRWVAPSATNGQPVTGYLVRPSLVGVAQPAQSFSSTATTGSVTGLTNGSTYTFTVAAQNSNGTGNSSAPSPTVIVGTPTPPPPPTVLPTNGGVDITWARATANGAAIDHYYVRIYANGTLQFTDQFGPTDPGANFIGLDNGTGYAFSVEASNANGTGVASGLSAVAIAGSPTAPRTR
jgi:predicted RNA-binding protein with TRAM domain